MFNKGSLTVETSEQVVAIYHYDQIKDGARCRYIPKTRACDGKKGELKGIQREIKNVINFVNDIKNISGTLLGQATDLTNQIESLIDDASTFISNLIKTLLGKVRGYVVNKFNAGLKDLINLVPPNLIPKTNLAAEKGADAIQCGFNKIISSLFDLVKGLLEDIIEKYVNAPMCAVEQFVIDVLDNVLGDITDTVKSALDAVTGIIGKVTSFLDQGFGILEGILSFISCEEKADCSMVEQWSFWYGAKCFGDEVSENFDAILKDLGKNAGDIPGCNTDQLPCGPPSLVVDGFGDGAGALGNPIVSQSGSILGVDLISAGQGYLNPNVQIVDTCGNGNGVVAVAKVKNPKNKNRKDKKDEGILEDIIIIEPGVGFLPVPDSSTGANQDVYSNPTDTIYEKPNKDKKVYKCGELMPVRVGDKLYLPAGTTTAVYDDNGNVLQTLNGLGQLTAVTITANGNVTVPCESLPVGNVGEGITSAFPGVNQGYPTTSNRTYPVALGISTIFVTNPGIGYTSGDSITITPDNGALIIPIINDGQLVGGNVVQPGIGFTEIPRIVVNSNTGFNANAVPVFKVIRLDETPDEIPLGTPLIEVVDCVGRTVNRVAHPT